MHRMSHNGAVQTASNHSETCESCSRHHHSIGFFASAKPLDSSTRLGNPPCILHVSRRASAWFSTQTPHFSKFSKLPSLPWFQPGDVHSASRASGSLWTHHEDFGSSNMFQPSTKPKPHQAVSSRIKPPSCSKS